MSKIKVSFEITDIWSMQAFRNFIKTLLSDEETFEVFIISNNDSSSYIRSVGNSLNMDNDHIIISNFSSDKLEKITMYNIDIHLDNIKGFADKVELETEGYGIFVSSMWNGFYSDLQYVIDFDTYYTIVTEEKNNE